ncbi:HNH endonuclease [Sphingobacterium siyangense]|uniref:HNH endonuclease n=1 Tax=Sphingobacterium siyangense TaxID=459529 RepID=UPI003DA1FF6F
MEVAEDIKWIKNVKRNNGEGWAYENAKVGNNFYLNWPTKMRGSAETPKTGEVIVLFQKPNLINGQRNRLVHLTHLVVPVSEDIHVDENSLKHRWCREVKLLAKAEPIQAIPNPGYYNFFKPNRGLTNPIINLGNRENLTVDEVKVDLWELFGEFFSDSLSSENLYGRLPAHMYEGSEGDKIVRAHILQELTRRNPAIVRRAKEEALKKGNGRIRCECCGFDFVAAYGPLGDRFIECHHKIHLNKGARITRIEDLALVCANCHRMLHRRKAEGGYHDVNSLQLILKEFII